MDIFNVNLMHTHRRYQSDPMYAVNQTSPPLQSIIMGGALKGEDDTESEKQNWDSLPPPNYTDLELNPEDQF